MRPTLQQLLGGPLHLGLCMVNPVAHLLLLLLLLLLWLAGGAATRSSTTCVLLSLLCLVQAVPPGQVSHHLQQLVGALLQLDRGTGNMLAHLLLLLCCLAHKQVLSLGTASDSLPAAVQAVPPGQVSHHLQQLFQGPLQLGVGTAHQLNHLLCCAAWVFLERMRSAQSAVSSAGCAARPGVAPPAAAAGGPPAAGRGHG